MASVQIGSVSTQGSKELTSFDSRVEIDGLVLITEKYTIRKQDENYFRDLLRKGLQHNAFSSNSEKYSRMRVETSRIEQKAGGFSELTVNYAGLTTLSGLPPADVSLIGQSGAGVFGPDVVIVAKYVSEADIFDLVKQTQGVAGAVQETDITLPSLRSMPRSINGVALPANPRPPFYARSKNQKEQQQDYDAAIANYKRLNPDATLGAPVFNFVPQVEMSYGGYRQSSISLATRGAFLQIEEQFSEYFSGSDVFYAKNGRPDLWKINKYAGSSNAFRYAG